ncbi:ABC transporter ATP-binding protein [Anaerocolumna cellulosilytica]|uniref:ABC transporter ATP-binding protein n=1 Tax=Anaerocolumna cellulosilytica TaxID=433286 RepID=A0A6S6R6X2_9FIRM|nr:Fe-S cluster assembly ATPase SufC [Anaerocolumna cellulosilytica]MBB5194025.1 Fe-S cluster assembly ATP-binding protein [Anaerocolumna cellulosilytica]BCJ94761.1 ABC transporter ATP-binding protein [Anaerocolumna cellulosilytica]
MKNTLLEIQNLNVHIEEKEILKSFNIKINQGEVHVIMGPNGAGKSTLGYTIMGHPKYEIKSGSIHFEGEDITEEKPDIRAKKGIFLSFQNPEELSGVTLENFIRTAKTAVSSKPVRIMAFKKELHKTMDNLGMDKQYGDRYLNVGFSGGEKKKAEILQMLMLEPKLAILDETDSGLDVDAVKIVSQGVKNFKDKKNSLLIITHNTKILEYLHVDYVHILLGGKLVKTGDASLIGQVNKNGYKEFFELV